MRLKRRQGAAQEIKNFEKERDSRLKEAEKALKQAKEAVTKARAQIKEKEEFVTSARVEKEAAGGRAALDEQISAADASITELQTEADSMEKDVAEKQRRTMSSRQNSMNDARASPSATRKFPTS